MNSAFFFSNKQESGRNYQKYIFCSLASGKLLVTTGIPTITSVKTESFDVDASTTCQSLPAFPSTSFGATGAFVNNKVVICGGAGLGTKCYTLGRNENTWTLSGNTIASRLGSASLEINNKLVIFGGLKLSSTEEIDVDTGTATAGPNMPLEIYLPCAVKLNTTTALIIGGYDGSSELRSTYFYDANVKSFTPGPYLKAGRYAHACSILNTGTESL